MDAYCVDYLCVDKQKRKSGIAPQLIQTHHYNQRHATKEIVVTIFKREQELTGIVPMCVYTTFGFSVQHWAKPSVHLLNGLFKLVQVTTQNFFQLHDFMRSFTTNNQFFDLFIETERSNQLELIKTNNVFIFLLLEEAKIVGAYFFRKTCVFVQTNLEVLSCFASLNKTEDDIFIQGFKNCFWDTCEKHSFRFASIENISHNSILIENLKKKTTPSIESPTAYFFYNFAYPTMDSRRVFVFI